jgi:hypothetical protein
LVGREQLINITNGIGEVFWKWSIDGKIRQHAVIVHIDVPNEKWQGGSIWRNLLDSLEVIND